MSFEQISRIILVAIGLALTVYWIIPLGKLAWFHPHEFEKIMSERAMYHWLSVNNPKYNWKSIIFLVRVFTLIVALALLYLGIELLLGLMGLMK
jgi:hypothetical protein